MGEPGAEPEMGKPKMEKSEMFRHEQAADTEAETEIFRH